MAMDNQYTVGSLFDGSGGFPLAGALCGFEPRCASEVEPYPIAVTKSRLPNMKHLGNISNVNGGKIEPVDIITFGSPCQDLSVAGKRAGLKHESNGDDETTRSGLFMEAVRIIKEMREATNGVYPTFAIWENVPGAFSSNGGEDFRIVLEELIKIVEPTAVMPAVSKGGWAYADSFVGDGWSLAYRVFDAQYWGVPQRRRRIFLVADFRGERAQEILFKREGLRGYFETGRTPWQTTTSNAQGSAGADDCEGEGFVNTIGFCAYNHMLTGDIAATLSANSCMTATRIGPSVVERRSLIDTVGFDSYNQAVTGTVTKPVTASAADSDHVPLILFEPRSQDGVHRLHDGVAPTLNTAQGGQRQPCVSYPDASTRYIVRRLIPTECARLQGFPDWWGIVEKKDSLTDEEYRFWLEVRNTHAAINGKKVQQYTAEQMLTWYNKLWTDSSEYKMWGNGIALPCALYVMQGIADALQKKGD